MSDRPHAELRHDIGAYVLGALDPAERDRLEGHLSGCPACRDEVASLAALPGLLSRLRDDLETADVAAPPVGPLVERLGRETTRVRRRQRWLVAAAAAAIVVASAAVGLAAWPGAEPAGATRYVATEGASTATVVPKQWGMIVELEARGLPDRPGFVARAVALDGHSTQIASWTAVDGPVHLEGSCYLPADEVAAVEIVAAPGGEVVEVLRPG